MNRDMSVKRVMDALIPISRFNRGEASKIFDEVRKTGTKIIMKNNVPVGVIVEPGRYEEMMELLEDYALYFEAEKRMNAGIAENTRSEAQIMESLGISNEELDNIDVEID